MARHEDSTAQELDTDTKVALLASLLEPISFPIETYLQALTHSKGDVSKAAEELLLPRIKSSGKRKVGTSLHSWLTAPRGSKVHKRDSATPEPANPIPSLESKPISPSKSNRPAVDLLTVLRQPSSNCSSSANGTKPKAGPQPALLLTSQKAIDTHDLPLSLLTSPLSPSLASALYLTMMEESESWDPNRFYLAGKWVESPHTTTVYKRVGGGYGSEASARYFYSGTELAEPKDYPPLLHKAAELVEQAVNASLQQRKRLPLEWAGKWRANVCGANRYDGAGSSVGWHADQLTYLGPYTTIASLSLGTPRAFRLRQTDTVDPNFATSSKPIRTYEVNLGHNSLVLMNAGCQERYKHTVPTQKALDLFRLTFDQNERQIPLHEQKTYTSRINITFRFYRDDFHPCPGTGPLGARQGTPVCKCGIPTLLRADQKAKARSRLAPPSPSKAGRDKVQLDETNLAEDDMMFFWQCQSPGQTGDMKGCGFFKILDMKAEGRGPCLGDSA